MSEAFLYELLQESNVVRLEGEQCGICLEKYNTLSRETGTMEVAIRLPCNHIIGSACIATWLKDTNNCPFCRREFFQAQPRPYLEHGIFDGPENEDELDQQTTSAIIEDFCDNLGLSSGVSIITRYLVQNLTESRIMDERDPHWCVIAVGIYMGSHIAREPRSPREIAEFAGLGAGRLREAYDRIYPEREELIDNHLNTLLAEVFDETGLLNWPARGVELTDEEIESNRDLQMLRERCEQACNELGLDPVVAGLAAHIETRYVTTGVIILFSEREITAASILMASHMMWQPVSVERLARTLRLRESPVRNAYRAAYGHQDILRRQPQLNGSGGQSMESLLRRLPYP